MLEKKITNDINTVNLIMMKKEMPTSDQGKDVMRTVVRGCTSFENAFDNIIKIGKKEGLGMFRQAK